jgi:hypothetical protein
MQNATKTLPNPRRRSSMKTRALFTATCLAAMLLAQGTVKAITYSLNVIENSPTSLSVTLDGVSSTGITVDNLGNDRWEVSSGSSVINLIVAARWQEPDNSSLFNDITSIGNLLEVGSDFFGPGNSYPADGTSVAAGNAFVDGVFGSVSATFHDKEASVPDGGSTAALLGVALLGVGFLGAKISRNPVTLAG